MVERTCLLCNGVFVGESEDTLARLRKHQKECTKEEPFKNDDSVDYYKEPYN